MRDEPSWWAVGEESYDCRAQQCHPFPLRCLPSTRKADLVSRPALGWYARRLARMSPSEVLWRSTDGIRRGVWARHQVTAETAAAAPPLAAGQRRLATVLPPALAEEVPRPAVDAVVAAAERLLAGEWTMLGVTRGDLAAPDWFRDPVTGRRAPRDELAFRINHRSQEETGNVKQVWEPSRHQHLSLLAAGWYLTHRAEFAERVAAQLTDWWRCNPVLSGVHWTSGIELGLRLISWTWIRRLLDDWPGVRGLFDDNPVALQQVYWHQRYLATFPSRGSSANNHLVAEAAGQLVSCCALPWFTSSDRWRAQASRRLERALAENTFATGVNRELASEYHGFVAELGLVAAVEADAAAAPLGADTWSLLARMLDGAAALVDETLRAPRQGDGDSGRVLLLDPPAGPGDWGQLLALGGSLIGPVPWWPRPRPTLASVLLPALSPDRRLLHDRPVQRPAHFADAGITVLRTGRDPEIWCRCDGGPHGFLSIAGHAHADALSLEARHGGVDILADPGTYCYHGEPAWRAYFRSTIAHNSVEVAGRSQSVAGGPFLWTRHASSRVTGVTLGAMDGRGEWRAEHDGYADLKPPVRHQRRVRLDPRQRSLEVVDRLSGAGSHPLRMAWHLGPEVDADLVGSDVRLHWRTRDGCPARGLLSLPAELVWEAHRGGTAPILGWYSPEFGRRVPTWTLLGTGHVATGRELETRLQFES